MKDGISDFTSGLIIDPINYIKAGFSGSAFTGLKSRTTGEVVYDAFAMAFEDEEYGKKVIESIISYFPQREDKDDYLIVSFVEYENTYDTFIYEDPIKMLKRPVVGEEKIQISEKFIHQIMRATGQSKSNDYLNFKAQYSLPHQYHLLGVSTKGKLLSERGLLKYHIHFHMYSELEESTIEYQYIMAKKEL